MAPRPPADQHATERTGGGRKRGRSGAPAWRRAPGEAGRDQLLEEGVGKPLAVLLAIITRRIVVAVPQAAAEILGAELLAAFGREPGGKAAIDEPARLVLAARFTDVVGIAVQVDAARECDPGFLRAVFLAPTARNALVVHAAREVGAAVLAGRRQAVLLHALAEGVARAGGTLLGISPGGDALAEDLVREFRAAPPAAGLGGRTERQQAALLGLLGQLLAASGYSSRLDAAVIDVARVIGAAFFAGRRLALRDTRLVGVPRARHAVVLLAARNQAGLVDRVGRGLASLMTCVGCIGLGSGDAGKRGQREAGNRGQDGRSQACHTRPPLPRRETTED